MNGHEDTEPPAMGPADVWASCIGAALSAGPAPWVIHLPSAVVGMVSEVYLSGEYIDENGGALTAPVLKLADGNAFVAEPDNFRIIDAELARYYDASSALLRATTEHIATMMALGGVDMDTGILLLRAMLAAQVRGLSRGDTLPSEEASGALG